MLSRPLPRRRSTALRDLLTRRRLLSDAILLILVAAGAVYLAERAPEPRVSVFPAPGSRVASPQTQIALRGLPLGRLGRIVVTGSRSGRHPGRLRSDSDGRGASFLPNKPFLPGEVVTVRTGLAVDGARKGTFRFTVASPAGPVPNAGLPPAARVAGDVLSFSSRPDLTPAAVQITDQSGNRSPADIFLSPQQGPLQNGPMIVAPDGSLVWFHPLPAGEMAADFRVQRYQHRRVLTWWQGYSGAGIGVGEDVIDSASYQQLAVIRAANGLSADLHEFVITPDETALITAYYPVYWNVPVDGRPSRRIVLDSVVQEIDIRTGLVLFQWDSLDHVPLSDSYEPIPKSTGQPYDYFHINSVQETAAGNLIISARNTWAAYEISGKTGAVIWTLGGKRSSFAMGPGTRFAFQHDVRLHTRAGSTVTLFDDGAGPPQIERQSRGETLGLNAAGRTATLIRSERHSPPLLSQFEGDVQSLPDGDQFLGWGQSPYFTEYDSAGQTVLDGHFVDANSSYRAYRFPWSATPYTSPAIAASTSGQKTTIHASWNGATQVASWRALAGSRRSSLRPTRPQPRSGFETELTIPAAPYVAVEALDGQDRVLSTSATVSPG
jgi:hypothetical protein